MNYSELESANPKLFWDGICRRSIPYSQGEGLNPGGVVTNPFAEEFVRGPFAPINAPFDPNGNIPIGGGTNYPKPWRSYAQKNSDASHSINVGPFARLVKIPDTIYITDTCVGESGPCGGVDGGIWGRLGVVSSSQNLLAFRAMDWYNQDEGNFGTEYYNNLNGTEWLTWKKWWDSASKATVNATWVNPGLDFVVEVEVAYDTPDIGDDDYFPGQNLNGVANASYDLLVGMVAIAAAARWIF
jgi:hypothetical protein